MPPKKKPVEDAVHAVGHAVPDDVPDPRLTDAAALITEASAELARLSEELGNVSRRLGKKDGETFDDAIDRLLEQASVATPEQWQKIKRQCGDTVDDAAAVIVTLDLARGHVQPEAGEDLDDAVARAIDEAKTEVIENAKEASRFNVEKVALVIDQHGVLGPAWRKLHAFDQQQLEAEIQSCLTEC